MKIAVIEDYLALRRALRLLVERLGHECTGEDYSTADVVLVDMHPNGLEKIAEIHEAHPGCRIIAMSGAFDWEWADDLCRDAMRLGAEKCCPKPTSPDALREILSTD